MARFLLNEPPATPPGWPRTNHPLWSGPLKRLLKSRLISRSPRNAALFWGILQGVKRGAAPVTSDFILEAMEDHRRVLSTPPNGPPPTIRQRAFFRDLWQGLKAKPELFEASSSASWQAKRSDGGARAWLRQNFRQAPLDELVDMVELAPGRVEQVYGVPTPSFEEAVLQASHAPKRVMVSAVLEPLKVRLITKGDSLRYWVGRFFQKALWNHLQRFPQFVLTSRPLETPDILDVLEREQRVDGILESFHRNAQWDTTDLPRRLNFDKWVSGDYKSATDLLHIEFTRAAFDEAVSACGLEHLSDVLGSVLFGQEVHYPKWTGLKPFEQANGQLMGSILSFPLLCAINLACYHAALEEYIGFRGLVRIEDLPVLVNGDDILFRANDDFYDIWQRRIRDAGFKLSIGKNYISRSYLTINSQLFYFKDDRNSPIAIRRIPYLNSGLLLGQSKITGRETARLAPIWALYNEVVHTSVDPLRTHRRFLFHHRKVIDELTLHGQYNLFLPFERGGLGFRLPQGLRIRITSFQRRFATFLEQQFVKDPSIIHKIALVSKRGSSRLVLSYHRNPRFTYGPSIGPLPEDLVPPRDRLYRPPPLALEGEDPERPELMARLPRARVLREFRTGTFRRMGGNITSFPWRILERIALPTRSHADRVRDYHLLGHDPVLPWTEDDPFDDADRAWARDEFGRFW